MLLQIGDWVACTDSDVITRAPTRRKLERLVMETLVVLARRAGEVVMKEDIVAAVWHGRMAVSDHSVALAISKLRKALGDDRRAPRYVETIPKRGYRLIVPCHEVRRAMLPFPRSEAGGNQGGEGSSFASYGPSVASQLFPAREGG